MSQSPARRTGTDVAGHDDQVQDIDRRPLGGLLYDLTPCAQPLELLLDPELHLAADPFSLPGTGTLSIVAVSAFVS